MAIRLDGAIQQVTWRIDDSGKATTRANKNREDVIVTPSYYEARQVQRTNALLDLFNKTQRARDRDDEKNAGL